MSKKILMIGGSVRNCANQEVLVDNVKRLDNDTSLYEYIERVARNKNVSNSEGCGIGVAFGALGNGADVTYLRLNEYIDKTGKFHKENELLEHIEAAQGYVFLTPVYFGDRSSLVFDLMSLMKRKGIDFSGKVSAVASVGAKRNGGQETTNVFTLSNLMQMNSLAVGNGPPTSQYGGTAVGGNMGTMDSDYFGIMTAVGVGKKLSGTVELVNTEPIQNRKPVIYFWLLEDFPDRRLLKMLEEKITQLPSTAEWRILDLLQYRFDQCIACNRCPNRPDNKWYKCILQSDDMKNILGEIAASDGFIVSTIHFEEEREKMSVYQRFLERTRFIRRDNFMLRDRPFFSFSLNQLFADPTIDIKVFTSFIRHNTIGYRGLRAFDIDGMIKERTLSSHVEPFINYCSRSVGYREKTMDKTTIYKDIGYNS